MHFTSFTSRCFLQPARILALIAATFAALPANAQLPAVSSSADSPAASASNAGATAASAPASTRIEYASYVGQGYGGPRSFATATSQVAGKNWKQFAERLKTQPFPDYPRTEPAFFNWLAERGWELVECERREETVGLLGERDHVTRCFFRRVVAVVPASPEPGTTND